MGETNHVYTLKHPLSGEVRYIGRTNAPKNRLWDHVKISRAGQKRPVCNWIRKLERDGLYPVMEVIYEATLDEIVYAERLLILLGASYGLRLLNVEYGQTEYVEIEKGENYSRPKRTGWTHSPETRQKLSAAGRRRIPKPHTEETKQKISAAKLGRKRTPDQCARISAGLKGRNPTFPKGTKFSETHRANISESHKGYVMPDEQRANLSAAVTRVWAERKALKMLGELFNSLEG